MEDKSTDTICEVAEVLIGRLGSFDSSDKVLISNKVAHVGCVTISSHATF